MYALAMTTYCAIAYICVCYRAKPKLSKLSKLSKPFTSPPINS